MPRTILPTDPTELAKILLERRAKSIQTATAWQKNNRALCTERCMTWRKNNKKRLENEEKMAEENLGETK